MGNRTLSLGLILRALFLDAGAYDALRDDDNPWVEGLLLVVLTGVVTALLSVIGQLIAWAATPSLEAIQAVVLDALRQQGWWSLMASDPNSLAQFNQLWDLGWRFFPVLFGAPSPAHAAFNVLAWPVVTLLGWLIYGTLAHLFARLLRGDGSLNQTLGTTALAVSPLLLRGLGFVPFLVIGGVLSTWQLICRYMAVRSAHHFTWQRAFWATVLPFLVYLVFWIVIAFLAFAVLSSLVGR